MYRFPNEHNEICVPAGAREEFLEKEVADLKEELSRKTEMLYAMEAELRKVSEGQMEWISVEERLPEKGGYYLTVVENCERVCYSRFMLDKFGHDGVTHWMYPPEPPKQNAPTFKDVFLKAFPQAKLFGGGTPVVCAKGVFPQIGDNDECCDLVCHDCWDQPYFEEKEGEADA